MPLTCNLNTNPLLGIEKYLVSLNLHHLSSTMNDQLRYLHTCMYPPKITTIRIDFSILHHCKHSSLSIYFFGNSFTKFLIICEKIIINTMHLLPRGVQMREIWGRMLLSVICPLRQQFLWEILFEPQILMHRNSFPINLLKTTNVLSPLIFANVSIFLRIKLHVRYLVLSSSFVRLKITIYDTDISLWNYLKV